ncbi:MAG: hypothetical protein WDA05_06070 [Candidatus Methanomethylophilaceae archaeon]|jgi:hypothetical protein|nr:hypothetical protein [Candidatus Methanomethylophilaceae archaeon]MDD3128710.1 hypothetical protein [Candidatus Methanomethylophilaceae archaeon]MDD4119568.1 hypothetical protein [Candidatus Methanomethylophilaceae archaeon]MDD4454794.1 hypothetical protein [Candidatus Methanomethylophilaceae archaeon]MDI9378620.1 hypothetical protein [Candidatus Thermoplasmatota archaeon]
MGCTKELFTNRIAELRNEKDNTYLRKRNTSLVLAAVMAYALWLMI